MTNEKFSVFGKYVTEDEKERIKDSVIKSKKYGEVHLDEEYRKTPEEVKWLKKLSEYINDEFDDLEIERRSNIKKERVHFLPTEDFEEMAGKGSESGTGVYSMDMGRSLLIDKDAIKAGADTPRLKLFETALHEGLHSEQFHKIYGHRTEEETDESDSSVTGSQYRLGYANKNLPEEEYGHEHFRGLNEAVTQKTTKDIIVKHADDLAKIFNLKDKKEIEEYLKEESIEYLDEIAVVDKIAEVIAEKKGESKDEVWNRIKKGSFSGKMMHLREIERTFGSGSLRVLATMLSGIKTKLAGPDANIDINKKILEYFSIDDQKEKDKIALKILNQRERFAYLQRKKETERAKKKK